MINLPIGLSTGCFYDRPLLECLQGIRNAGFTLLEICSSVEHLDYRSPERLRDANSALGDNGLQPVSFHAPFRRDIDITAPFAAVRDPSVAEVERACEAAAALGAEHVVLHPGPETGDIPNTDRIERLEQGVASLKRIAGHCRSLGIRLVLENMLPHLLTGQVRELLWMLGSMSAEVGVCLDTGHALLSGDLHGTLQKLSGIQLCLVHASDNHGKHDDHLPPGRGNIDWHRLVRQLLECRFQGTVILELGGGRPKDDLLREAKEARDWLGSILADAQSQRRASSPQ